MALVILRTEVTDLMDARVEFEPSSSEAGRASARQIVLIDEECFLTLYGALDCRAETGVPGSDNYYIVFCCHNSSPFFRISSFLS